MKKQTHAFTLYKVDRAILFILLVNTQILKFILCKKSPRFYGSTKMPRTQ